MLNLREQAKTDVGTWIGIRINDTLINKFIPPLYVCDGYYRDKQGLLKNHYNGKILKKFRGETTHYATISN